MQDLLSDLNEPQRQAVTHVDGPLLVLAGAGSGKTRVITRRVAYLISQGIAPWNVLAITFTNKAAGEMRQRVEQLGVPRGATVSTFHALCARLLREFALEARLSSNYSIYDRADQIKLVKEAMQRLDLPADRMPPTRVHSTISNAKNDLKTPESFANDAGDFYTRKVALVFSEYERMLAANNALDFDDLLLRMAFLLRDHPQIRQALGQRYRYVLIDEYQDTNRAQYILAHGIAMDHENICVTGDPDQSIYAWRGADIGNILEFEHDYPTATVIRLEENYRSTAPILAAASRLIAHNRMRKDKTLWTRRQGGRDVHVLHCDTEHAEAKEIVRRIAASRRGGQSYSGMAVFYRVNSLSRVLEEELLKAGVPYRVARGVEFYNRKEIRDVLAYLRLIVNPADDLSCERIINTPARGIGNTTVGRLQDFARLHRLSLLEACRSAPQSDLSAAAAKKVVAFAKLIDSLIAEVERLSVREIAETTLRRSGLEDALKGDEDEGQDALSNVAELISTAAEFDSSSEGGTLADYLHQISLVSDADHFEGSSGAVTLMTLHAAKGLEFPVVFIVGCEAGLLPFVHVDEGDPRGPAAMNRFEEERRLAFVGMTRAQDELTLSCARYRMIRGRTTPQSASPFMGEMGDEGVKTEDLTGSDRGAFAGRGRAGAGRGGFYEEVNERALIEASFGGGVSPPSMESSDAPPPPPEFEYLRVGSRVRHPQFGVGKVVCLSQPWPQTRADIAFDVWGVKRIVLAMAKGLEVL